MIKIDVVSIANKIREDIKQEVSELKNKPCLATVIVGEDKASERYVRNKTKLCEELGIQSLVCQLPEGSSKRSIMNKVRDLVRSANIHGVLIQLPLPKDIDSAEIIDLIPHYKDVDGLTIINQGKLFNNKDGIVPCTPLGIMAILDELDEDVRGKDVCVLGKSNLLGKPLSILLANRGATVTICNSNSENIIDKTYDADIVISCTGVHGLINPLDVKDGALVIDAGTSYIGGKLVGDFDVTEFEKRNENTIFFQMRDDLRYTPVPFGVGQMTTTMLAYNTVKCYKLQNGLI